MVSAALSRDELVAQYSVYSQLLEEVKRRVDLLNASLSEIVSAKSTLNELTAVDEGEELLVPVGAGVLVRAKLASKSSVLATIGANLMVEKSVEDAKKFLDEREQRVKEALQKSVAEYQALVNKVRELEQRIQALQR